MGSLAFITVSERPLAVDVRTMANQFVRVDVSESSHVLACVVSCSSLCDHIRERQYDDLHLLILKDTVQHDDTKDVTIGDDRVLRMQVQITMPNMDGLYELNLEEAHSSRYKSSIHMAVYEALYGRRCGSPVGWFEPSEARILGTD
ncbi:uncharacterized protein [Nicotiana tomentosiformis]|uniref:uncharacterized protein n=1 Tax=Nicotiana tomentosiformis TaxID=4098 RepID=UPI00388CD1F7